MLILILYFYTQNNDIVKVELNEKLFLTTFFEIAVSTKHTSHCK